MKIRQEDLVIDQERPFVNCKLERERFATILTDIVETYSDGFVLAINNEWGTGKTTFVKMWQQHLINNEFRTIYFNAWENDFDTNPLVSIVSELNSLTNKTNSKAFKSIIEKGAVLTRNIVPGLVKGVLTKYGADEILTTAIEDSAKGATEIL